MTLTFKQLNKKDPVETVGELREILAQLPQSLPIDEDMTKLVWFNAGSVDEHLSFQEDDGAFDEDDDPF